MATENPGGRKANELSGCDNSDLGDRDSEMRIKIRSALAHYATDTQVYLHPLNLNTRVSAYCIVSIPTYSRAAMPK